MKISFSSAVSATIEEGNLTNINIIFKINRWRNTKKNKKKFDNNF